MDTYTNEDVNILTEDLIKAYAIKNQLAGLEENSDALDTLSLNETLFDLSLQYDVVDMGLESIAIDVEADPATEGFKDFIVKTGKNVKKIIDYIIEQLGKAYSYIRKSFEQQATYETKERQELEEQVDELVKAQSKQIKKKKSSDKVKKKSKSKTVSYFYFGKNSLINQKIYSGKDYIVELNSVIDDVNDVLLDLAEFRAKLYGNLEDASERLKTALEKGHEHEVISLVSEIGVILNRRGPLFDDVILPHGTVICENGNITYVKASSKSSPKLIRDLDKEDVTVCKSIRIGSSIYKDSVVQTGKVVGAVARILATLNDDKYTDIVSTIDLTDLIASAGVVTTSYKNNALNNINLHGSKLGLEYAKASYGGSKK